MASLNVVEQDILRWNVDYDVIVLSSTLNFELLDWLDLKFEFMQFQLAQ